MAAIPAGQFCWADLAARNASRAVEFYAALFGWTARSRSANGGSFVSLAQGGRDFASLYQLRRNEIEAGIPSHWTPYVQVDSVSAACEKATAFGGSIAVAPFAVDGIARIAIIVDPGGAPFGVWEDLPA